MLGAIILAAGQSKRFGYKHKLLQPLEGKPLILHAVDAVATLPVGTIIVVTGRDHMRVARLCRTRAAASKRLHIVRNCDLRTGMASSLQIGLSVLPRRCDAALIYLADMPGIKARTLNDLCARRRPNLDYLRPVYAGQPGHPVIVSRRLFRDMLNLQGDEGAQKILARIPADRRQHLKATQGCVIDIDTPAALRKFASSTVPDANSTQLRSKQ